jgi:hypothetical protein
VHKINQTKTNALLFEKNWIVKELFTRKIGGNQSFKNEKYKSILAQ